MKKTPIKLLLIILFTMLSVSTVKSQITQSGLPLEDVQFDITTTSFGFYWPILFTRYDVFYKKGPADSDPTKSDAGFGPAIGNEWIKTGKQTFLDDEGRTIAYQHTTTEIIQNNTQYTVAIVAYDGNNNMQGMYTNTFNTGSPSCGTKIKYVKIRGINTSVGGDLGLDDASPKTANVMLHWSDSNYNTGYYDSSANSFVALTYAVYYSEINKYNNVTTWVRASNDLIRSIDFEGQKKGIYYLVKGLKLNTEYKFKVVPGCGTAPVSSNKLGAAISQQITTLDAACTLTNFTVKSFDITTEIDGGELKKTVPTANVKIKWEDNRSHYPVGHLFVSLGYASPDYVEIFYGKGSQSQSEVPWEGSKKFNNLALEGTIDGLDQDTWYVFKVVAHCDKDISKVLGTSVNKRTAKKPCDSSPIILSTPVTDKNQIKLDWTENNINLNLPGAEYYSVYWCKCDRDNFDETRKRNVQGSSYTFTDLEPNQCYYLKVVGYCNGVKGYESKSLAAYTPSACVALLKLDGVSVSETEANLAFHVTNLGSAQVYYKLASESYTSYIPLGKDVKKISNLLPDTTYNIKLEPLCSDGVSSPLQGVTEISIRTKSQIIPPTPEDPVATAIVTNFKNTDILYNDFTVTSGLTTATLTYNKLFPPQGVEELTASDNPQLYPYFDGSQTNCEDYVIFPINYQFGANNGKLQGVYQDAFGFQTFYYYYNFYYRANKTTEQTWHLVGSLNQFGGNQPIPSSKNYTMQINNLLPNTLYEVKVEVTMQKIFGSKTNTPNGFKHVNGIYESCVQPSGSAWTGQYTTNNSTCTGFCCKPLDVVYTNAPFYPKNVYIKNSTLVLAKPTVNIDRKLYNGPYGGINNNILNRLIGSAGSTLVPNVFNVYSKVSDYAHFYTTDDVNCSEIEAISETMNIPTWSNNHKTKFYCQAKITDKQVKPNGTGALDTTKIVGLKSIYSDNSLLEAGDGMTLFVADKLYVYKVIPLLPDTTNKSLNPNTVVAVKQEITTPDATINPDNVVLLFPNPTDGILHIELGSKDEVVETIIYDVTGKQVRKELKNSTLDLTYLPTGTYLITVSTKLTTVTKKIVKK